MVAAYIMIGSPSVPPDARFYVAPDRDHAKSFTNVFAFSSKFRGTEHEKLFRKMFVN